MKTQREKT